MNIGIIIQARMESKRLPGKMNKKILNKHLLEWVILRSKKAKLAKKIVVAIPDTKKSSVLLPLIKRGKVNFYQGSLNNVLSRFLEAAEKFKIDPAIRITGDCPLIDPVLIDQSIKEYKSIKNKPDYFFIKGYPFGLGDIEIISFGAFKKILKITKNPYHLEHIVSFICENPDLFKIKVETAPPKFFRKDLRVCVDEPQDLVLVENIIKHFEPKEDFGAEEILKYLDENPKIAAINKSIRHSYMIPKDALVRKKLEKKILWQTKKIIKQKSPKPKNDWDLIIVLSGGEENIQDISNNKRNEDKDRLETAFKIAKQVSAGRLKMNDKDIKAKDILIKGPIVYYNASNEQNDNLRKLIKKEFLRNYGFPKEKIIVSKNLNINNTKDQFSKMPSSFLRGKRKIVIVTSAYHILRVKKYVKRHQKKFSPEKTILYPAEPKIFELEKSKKEAEKIFKYF
ncbi:MAG: ElyC/SanA/YdcF family protein [Patescibacteria group bacterium]